MAVLPYIFAFIFASGVTTILHTIAGGVPLGYGDYIRIATVTVVGGTMFRNLLRDVCAKEHYTFDDFSNSENFPC